MVQGDVGLEVVNSVPEEFLEFDIKWKDWGADLRLALTKKWAQSPEELLDIAIMSLLYVILQYVYN